MNTIGLVFVTLLAVQCCVAKSLRGLVHRSDCPYQRPETDCEQGLLFSSGDDSECYDDSECLPLLKCCMQGCGNKCVAPVHYSTWSDAPVDLAIVFDASETTWEKVKKMIKDVINEMAVTKNVTHIAMVTTAQHSHTLLRFNQLNDSEISRANVLSIIEGFERLKRAGKLSKVLVKAKAMFKESNGARQDAIKVLLVITDANMSTEESKLALATSRTMRQSGVLIHTVGVTMDMSLMRLVEIATSDQYVWPGVDREMLWMLKELESQPGNIKYSSQ